MAQDKRVQVLMEPVEFAQLEAIASGQGRSVADLIREAVRERWLVSTPQRSAAAEALNALGMPVLDLDHLEGALTVARTEGLR